MIFKIFQLESDGKVLHKRTVNIENVKNQLFDIEIIDDKKGKSLFYHLPTKGKLKQTVGERGENYLDLKQLVDHFTLSDRFDNDVLTNGRQLIAYRTSEYLDQETLAHIEQGCLGREYKIEKTTNGDKFKIIITL